MVTRWNLYSFLLLVPKGWASIWHNLHSYRNFPGCLLLLITCFRKFSWKYRDTNLSWFLIPEWIGIIISYWIIWRVRAVWTLLGRINWRILSIMYLILSNHRVKNLQTFFTLYGFSPVWIRKCRFKWLKIFVVNSQWGHCKWIESFWCCDLICL